jgi:regulatory protein
MKPPSPDDLRARALRLLARREYSREELQQRLRSHAESEDDISALLDQLEQRGWLSEARFAEQLVHARQGRYGSQRIAHELREKGVGDETIEGVLAQVRQDEYAVAKEVWRKKFGAPPADIKDRARQVRFLQSRGFRPDVVFRVVGQDED